MNSQVDVLVLTLDHLRVLSSVSCNEVMSTLDAFLPMSAKDVGDIINKSPASVLEHLHKLLEVGLVIEAGTRKKRSRIERLFLPAGKVIRFQVQGQSSEALDAYMDRVRGNFRLAERNFADLLKILPEDGDISDFLIYKTYTAKLDRERALLLRIATDEVLNLLKSFEPHGADGNASDGFLRYNFMAVGLPTADALRKRRKDSQE